MNVLTPAHLTELTLDQAGPCLSLYLPTETQHPDNLSDAILFRGLVRQAELALLANHAADRVAELLAPWAALAEDEGFWTRTMSGLAVFAAPGVSLIIDLPRTVKSLVVVADSFHTKPLRRMLQSGDRYQVVGLNRNGIKLFEGSRDSIHVLRLAADVKGNLDLAANLDRSEPNQSVASLGSGGGVGTPHHSGGGHDTVTDGDDDRYFRSVDRAVLENFSRPSGLPLILAALPEHHHRFHEVSHNPFLTAEGIKTHPDDLSLEQLRDQAWKIIEPQYRARLAALADDFAVAKSTGLGTDDLDRAAAAAVAGQVATVLLEADRELPGHIHAGTGNVHHADSAAPDPAVDDLLDDLGQWVIKMGGRVVVVPAAQMPTTTGLAAILRYKVRP
jgi:hypothetical protein